jgi:tRNA (guanine37-N1)-methyltransferase
MLQIDVVTLFPDMFKVITEYGVTGRAVEKDLVRVSTWNPRDFTNDKHRTVDDRPYGGGPGMVMKVTPLRDAIHAARESQGQGCKVICLSPQGRRLDHSGVMELSQCAGMIFVAGRYEGIDERVIETEVDEEWSIGDYVLSGGELAAMVMIDAIIRTIPGVLGHADSAREDSFFCGLLDYPHYTRPEEIEGLTVPAVLVSGNHEDIYRWRLKQALGRTWLRRPDLLAVMQLNVEQQGLLEEYKNEYTSREDQEQNV